MVPHAVVRYCPEEQQPCHDGVAWDGEPMRSGQGRRSPRRRRTAAAPVAGALAGIAVLAGCGIVGPDEPERRAGTGTADAGPETSPITVGDCIDDPGMEDPSDIPVLPCDDQHVFEAFAATRMPDGEYPGQGEANAAATDFCAEEFRSFIGVDYDASVLELLYFYPVEESWDAEGDRQILCFVAEQDETPVAGTLRDAGR
ncbi:septum formation family protein [Arthrobacter antioxidans]|uniref:septum formation family protein n=1 Tax=Arthrobacter antioxidans TaxID=2895818 RepID=UPI001FFECB73|nr:septum formation family protein [Arthrobacter antioxidans]